MLQLAKYYRSLFDIPVVGITGSVGKTTTKDMIASVLSQKYNTLWTLGNFNNDLGVPLTLFRLEESHEAAVIEMGMTILVKSIVWWMRYVLISASFPMLALRILNIWAVGKAF